ncbi:hypothetical protein [Labrys sp. ZIDIC5]|uniref:hypothetical protein n=1 Tax=Labrys sedimenti TaxID=3106036 RepID=UPI002ACA5C76|nr:hypothetical protein [Labrys sp. ZIDIC5]MDZ5448889.1 hypothetical protein [Labrys sp. ZIDIC5]
MEIALSPAQWRYHEKAKVCTARGDTFAVGQVGTGVHTAKKMIAAGLWREAAPKPWRRGFAVHYEVTPFGMTVSRAERGTK